MRSCDSCNSWYIHTWYLRCHIAQWRCHCNTLQGMFLTWQLCGHCWALQTVLLLVMHRYQIPVSVLALNLAVSVSIGIGTTLQLSFTVTSCSQLFTWHIRASHSVKTFISKTQPGLRRSDPLLAAIISLLVSDPVGTMSSCSLLAFLLSVSLVSSRLRCLCFSVSISNS